MRVLLGCLLLLTACPRDYDHFFTEPGGACGQKGTWSVVSQLPEGRQRGAAVISRGKIYYLGGLGPGGLVSSTVFSQTIGEGTWTEEAMKLPAPRAALTAVVDGNGDIHVLGGFDGSMTSQTNHWILSPGGWSDGVPTTSTHASHVSFFAAGQLFVVDFTSSESLKGSTWLPIAIPLDPRDQSAVVLAPGGEALMIGGSLAGKGATAVDRYDPERNVWDIPRPAMLGTGRKLHAAVLGGDGLIYAIGGVDPNGQVLATVETFDSAKWSASATALPEPRFGAAAVVTPDGRILLIGGSANIDTSDKVYAYCP